MKEAVSLIIPLYNGRRYIAETLESALAQTRPPDEILVIDDGSADDGADIASSFASVTVVRRPHEGVAPTMNAGLGRAKGSLVSILDADDLLLPETLEAEVACLTERPEAALVYGQARFIDARSEPLPGLFPARLYPAAENFGRLLERNFILSPSGVLIRRSVIEEVGAFDQAIGHAVEYDLWLRVARRYPLACLEQVLIEYRRHPAAMTGNVGGHFRGEQRAVGKYSVEETLDALQKVYPDEAEAQLRLAMIRLKCDDFAEARQIATAQLQEENGRENGKDFLANFILGQCALGEKEWAEAEQFFLNCRKLAPDAPEILNNLGALQARLHGDWPAAARLFAQALALKMQYNDARRNLALARQENADVEELRLTTRLLRKELVPPGD
jgi:tetratricopeptide (TPR) repeat protein